MEVELRTGEHAEARETTKRGKCKESDIHVDEERRRRFLPPPAPEQSGATVWLAVVIASLLAHQRASSSWWCCLLLPPSSLPPLVADRCSSRHLCDCWSVSVDERDPQSPSTILRTSTYQPAAMAAAAASATQAMAQMSVKEVKEHAIGARQNTPQRNPPARRLHCMRDDS